MVVINQKSHLNCRGRRFMIQSTMMEYPLTLTHLLDRAGTYFKKMEIVSRLPDRSLHRYTYADFTQRAWQLAEALQKAGLQPGDRVATLMWNHYAHLEAYFGIPVAGGVLHTLNLRLAPDDIAYIANHAEDRFLIVDDILLPLLEKFRDQAPFERVFVVPLTGAPIESYASLYESYEELLKTADGSFVAPELKETDAAAMCYTSGTTGRPKGVVYSHRALVLHTLVQSMPDVLNISMHDTVTPVVPLFHANGWGFAFAATMVGAKQVYPGPYLDAQSLLDLFAEEGVNCTAGVPTIWLGIAQALEHNPGRWDVSGLRMAVGGAAIPEGLMRTLESYGAIVQHAWGMTETSPLATASFLKAGMEGLPADEQYKRKAMQGVAVPFVEMRIMRDGVEAPWDGETMGEIQVRGPWITMAYHNLEGSTSSFSDDGWLCTGDIGVIDEEGYMKITDRVKDLIKSGGEWISSVDLENALMGHPAVAEAAVVAVPDPKWQERPLAAVVVKPGYEVTEEELRQHLAGSFPNWYLPDHVVFIEEIPRTSTGKFMKAKLRDEFRNIQVQQ